MEYLIMKVTGNGYHCHCCRDEGENSSVEEFESDDAALEYAEVINKAYREDKYDNDERVVKIYKIEKELQL